MDKKILIPGEVPKQAQFNKAERKIQTFLKGTILLLILMLIIVVVVYLHFKVQNEIKAADQAKVIEKILENKSREYRQYGKLSPRDRTDILGIINDQFKDSVH